MEKVLKKVFYIPRQLAILIISIYQKTLSPDHGWPRRMFPYGYCRYTPSCSDYGKEAFRKYGFLKGGLFAFWRIVRCNPWSRGGEDPLR